MNAGELSVGPGDGPKLVPEGWAVSEGEVGVEVLLPDRQPGNAGLLVRVSQPEVGADAFNGYEIALYSSSQTLLLGRHRQNFEPIRQVPCAVPTGEWIPLVVRLKGASLEVRVNGQRILQHEDREHLLTGTAIGLRAWQRQARFRRFWAERNGGRVPIPFEASAPGQDTGVASGWRPTGRNAAQARYAVESVNGCAVQVIGLPGGGQAGIAFEGRSRTGMPVAAGRSYRGFLSVLAEPAARWSVTLENEAGSAVYAQADLACGPAPAPNPAEISNVWQRLGFALAPTHSDPAARLAVKLVSPGTARIGRVFLEDGDWNWPEALAVERLPRIVFLKRSMLSAPPAIGCDLWAARPLAPGCAICVLDPARPETPPRTLFEDAGGCIYDLNLSLDGQTVFFSYARAGEKHWHLWEVGVDGTGLRQITEGPYYDVSPCEAPGGDLVFVSTRRFGHTVCQPGPASNLYRVARRGGAPRCLSMNTLSDTTPQLLPDGRVLFMRWEYVDRDLTFRQSLWTQNPDGTGYQLYFGNTIRDPATFWQARPLPGRSDRVLATFAPHHGYPHGAIGWIDRSQGPETPRGLGFDWITKEFPSIGDRSFAWSYRDPFPLDDRSFLCAYGGDGRRFRLYLHDWEDRRRLLYDDPSMHCFFPLALRPVPAPTRTAQRLPERTRSAPDLPEDHDPAAQPMGVCLLADVYQGLEPFIQRGRVKFIRIMEQVRKTEDIPLTPHTVDFGPRAYDQSPLMSYATYYAKRCWGTVPVEEDGSAHFEAPALREIYFQACDAEGRELQRMTSAAQFMPGESIGCVGCHEHRATSPRPGARPPLAARRPPSRPQKPAWTDDGVIDFVSAVQPVLDKYCVECHRGERAEGGYDLTGDKTRFFNMAYDNLLGRSRSYRQHKLDTGEMLPAEIAKGKPLVHFFWLLQTPTAVNQPLWAGSHASRLPDYLNADHCGRPIPLEERQRLHAWIDADAPYYGTYAVSRPRCGGKRDLCADPATGEPEDWFAKQFLPVYARRCGACHGEFPDTRLVVNWDGKTAWINFSRPQFSPALTAHLPKAQGGRGIATPRNGQSPPEFGPGDPDYQALLKAFETGARRALETPNVDMAGYRGRRREP